LERELIETLKAFRYHRKALGFIFDPYIQKGIRNILNIPYYVNISGITENSEPTFFMETELGKRSDLVLKRSFDHIINSMNMLAKYLKTHRRVKNVVDPKYREYLNLLTQELYLQGTSFIYLQEIWDGDEIKYSNTDWIQQLLVKAEELRLQLDETKNPLGYDPNKIFFHFNDENISCGKLSDNPDSTNWHYYMKKLFCDVNTAKEDFDDAVGEYNTLKGKELNFDDRLRSSEQNYLERINEICGDLAGDYTGDFCAPIDITDVNDLDYKCANDECSDVVLTFDQDKNHYSCQQDFENLYIMIGDVERKCYAGENGIGAVLNQINQVKLEQKAVKRRLANLMQTIDLEKDAIDFITEQNEDYKEYYSETTDDLWIYRDKLDWIGVAKEIALTNTDQFDKTVIGGMAFGFDTGWLKSLIQTGILTGIVYGERHYKEKIHYEQRAEAFKLFIQNGNDNLERELIETLKAFRYHRKALGFIFDPYIQKGIRNILNIPYYVNISGITENSEPTFFMETELGKRSDLVLKRSFDHIINSMNMLAKYLKTHRRVKNVVDPKYREYLNLLTQELYLQGTSFIYLQEIWDGDEIKYSNTDWIQQLLVKAEELRLQLDETKNPLGYDPNKIFFHFNDENISCGKLSDNPDSTNWHYYMKKLFCDVNTAKEDFDDAVGEYNTLKGKELNFDDRLRSSEQNYLERINEICGDLAGDYTGDFCAPIDITDVNDLDYKCANDECSDVVLTFDQDKNHYSCQQDFENLYIMIGDVERKCYAGENGIGAVLNQINQVKLEQKAVKRRLANLMQTIDLEKDAIDFITEQNEDYKEYYSETTDDLWIYRDKLDWIGVAKEIALTNTDQFDKTVIGGMAFGFDTGWLKSLIQTGILTGIVYGERHYKEKIHYEQRAEGLKYKEISDNIALAERDKTITKLQLEAHNLAMQYVSLHQQEVSLEYRKQQLLSKAQRYANYFSDANKSIIEYLIGDPQNHRLLRHEKIMDAEYAFEQAIHSAYKTAKSFEYHFNYPYPGLISNKVFSYGSISELFDNEQGMIAVIDNELKNRWDWGPGAGEAYHYSYAEISLRDILMPGVQTKYDPETGTEISKGIQFTRFIKSSQYRFQRLDDTNTFKEQIEIPFGVYLQKINGETDGRYKIDDQACMAQIEGMWVETHGENLQGQTFKYGLARSKFDDMKTCFKVKENSSVNNGEASKTKVMRWDISEESNEQFTVKMTSHIGECGEDDPNNNTASCSGGSDGASYRGRAVAGPGWKLIIPTDSSTQNENFFSEEDNFEVEDIKIKVRYKYKLVRNEDWQ